MKDKFTSDSLHGSCMMGFPRAMSFQVSDKACTFHNMRVDQVDQ